MFVAYDAASNDIDMTSSGLASDPLMADDTASTLTSVATRAASGGGHLASKLLEQSLSSITSTTASAARDSEIDFIRQQVNWYMIIAILSALVLVGMCFTICRLVMKATAHEKAGLVEWNRESLLYSRKDSIIPISLHFDQNDGGFP